MRLDDLRTWFDTFLFARTRTKTLMELLAIRLSPQVGKSLVITTNGLADLQNTSAIRRIHHQPFVPSAAQRRIDG